VTVGLIAGIVGVTMTESIGVSIFNALDIAPWGRWPLTMHSAAWGLYLNLGLAILISFFTQNKEEKEHQKKYHDFLSAEASLPASKMGLKPVAWIVTLVWFIFAIGPGAVLGNTVFGSPLDSATWTFGIPSIWAWQILWWALGVVMMWFLAYKMEMSTVPENEIIALVEDIGDAEEAKKARLDVDQP